MPFNPDFIPVSDILAERRPADTIVCARRHERLFWPEFTNLVSRLAGAFASEPMEPVPVTCVDPLNFLATLLALWQCGHTPVVPHNFQPGTLQQLSAHKRHEIDDERVLTLASRATGARLVRLDAAACQMILHTSGSSGEPKPVCKTLAQLDTEISTLENLWGGIAAGCGVLATVPHHHIYGLLFRLLWPLAAARPFDCCSCSSPDLLKERIGRFASHILVSSPSHLTRFPRLMELEDWEPAPRMLFSSGGPLPAETADTYRLKLAISPVEIFGSTETGGVAWRQRSGGSDQDLWTPLPGVSVNQHNDNALLLDSPFLPCRNWRMDDSIDLLPDGRFRLNGRLDRIVKLEGKRLALPEMETCLESHSWVACAAVVPLPDVGRLGVVVVPSTAGQSALETCGTRAMKQALRDHLKNSFEPVLLPRRFRFVANLPFSDRGKVTRQLLQSLFGTPDETDA